MSFENRTTRELVQIAAAGGGFELNGEIKTTRELVQIAAAGANSGANLIFIGLSKLSTRELVQIAAAGKGCVTLSE
ncbi:hypothetical protein [Photobacterium phosphoreum]|uniref:hypothetical protein n=1 Tax=Photobacterium phosphoreum TaxID=659 RepID=UPI00242CDFA3|nr:hypothetical protein [Photobacterium phosphoreum]